MPSIKKKSKAELLRIIRNLQEEIEAIHRFQQVPVVMFAVSSEEAVRDQPGFVSIEQYGRRYVLHEGEIGCVPGTRYVRRKP